MKKPFDDGSDFAFFLTGPVTASAPAMTSGHVTCGGAAPGSPIAIPGEELTAEAAFAVGGTGAPGSVVTVTALVSAGLTINLIFDAAAMAAPQSFRDGVTQAMAMICPP